MTEYTITCGGCFNTTGSLHLEGWKPQGRTYTCPECQQAAAEFYSRFLVSK